ncbi:hypothetical protein CDAR_294711 [Caerostris darwini]|uniref:Uncharacterized protein n=1 Tax=Caerostris darwini TaxID=1538125 RepID=A0AAV4UKI7_9ARAC|nr:hypothetical protein CDAR_294711 [Caerostris darwini]
MRRVLTIMTERDITTGEQRCKALNVCRGSRWRVSLAGRRVDIKQRRYWLQKSRSVCVKSVNGSSTELFAHNFHTETDGDLRKT